MHHFCILLQLGVACYDESSRHHDEKCVNLITIFKKIEVRGQKRSRNELNGFGKLNACSFQEKYEKTDIGTHSGQNCRFHIKPPKNLLHLWDFGRFSLILQRKIVKFKSCLNCWHATHIQYKAFLRRSKAFLSIRGEFGVNVPFKTAPGRPSLKAKNPA